MNGLGRICLAIGSILAAVVCAATLRLYFKPVRPYRRLAPRPENSARVDTTARGSESRFLSALTRTISSSAAGGSVHMLARRGAEVTFCVASSGRQGAFGVHAKARLEGLRSRHQADAAEVLGGARVVLFDYPDRTPSRTHRRVRRGCKAAGPRGPSRHRPFLGPRPRVSTLTRTIKPPPDAGRARLTRCRRCASTAPASRTSGSVLMRVYFE